MIFVTGDVHGSQNIRKLTVGNFTKRKELSKNDFVIVAGDFGNVWDNSNEDIFYRNWLTNCEFTTLFVDGNHENFDLLNAYPVDVWNGGKIHRITDSIFHLLRGQVFTIENKKIFTFGGATSKDKEFRIEGKSWWKEELPSEQEFSEGIKNLKQHDFKVDYIISHCASRRLLPKVNEICQKTRGIYEPDKLNIYFDEIEEKTTYNHWYMGHYHQDLLLDEKHSVLYRYVLPLGSVPPR